MNVAKLERIAVWLEAGAPETGAIDGGFDMRAAFRTGPDCGTTCCIAGAAIEFNAPVRARQMQWDANCIYPRPVAAYLPYTTKFWPEQKEIARTLLGLNKPQAHHLFSPGKEHGFEETDDWKAISPDWAARCIRNLIATGKVDWQGTKPKQQADNVVPIRSVA